MPTTACHITTTAPVCAGQDVGGTAVAKGGKKKGDQFNTMKAQVVRQINKLMDVSFVLCRAEPCCALCRYDVEHPADLPGTLPRKLLSDAARHPDTDLPRS